MNMAGNRKQAIVIVAAIIIIAALSFAAMKFTSLGGIISGISVPPCPSYSLYLNDSGTNKARVLRIISYINGMGFGVAKSLLASEPTIIRMGLVGEVADAFREELSNAGAIVEMVDDYSDEVEIEVGKDSGSGASSKDNIMETDPDAEEETEDLQDEAALESAAVKDNEVAQPVIDGPVCDIMTVRLIATGGNKEKVTKEIKLSTGKLDVEVNKILGDLPADVSTGLKLSSAESLAGKLEAAGCEVDIVPDCPEMPLADKLGLGTATQTQSCSGLCALYIKSAGSNENYAARYARSITACSLPECQTLIASAPTAIKIGLDCDMAEHMQGGLSANDIEAKVIRGCDSSIDEITNEPGAEDGEKICRYAMFLSDLGPNQSAVVQLIRILGVNLEVAISTASHAPSVIMAGVEKNKALFFKEVFNDVGAVVDIVDEYEEEK